MSIQHDSSISREQRKKSQRGGHISLDEQGRLRCQHMVVLFANSRSAFYARLRKGLVPRPDGYEGRHPYWKTATVRKALEARAVSIELSDDHPGVTVCYELSTPAFPNLRYLTVAL